MRFCFAFVSLVVAAPLAAQATYQITNTYGLGGPGGWDYLVPDPSTHRLYIGRSNRVMVVDETTAVDGAGFDAASGNAFASGADGTLTVIHQDTPDSYRVVQTLETMKGSRNMGLDPSMHAIFLSGARFEPQAPGARGRPKIVADSYVLLEVERR